MLSFKDFYENITIPVYEGENYLGTLKFEVIDEDMFEEAEYRPSVDSITVLLLLSGITVAPPPIG